MSTALILIDIQKDYFPGGRMELVGGIEAAGGAVRLLAAFRAAFDLGFACTIAQDACATLDLAFNGETIPARHVHGPFLAAMGAV